MARGQPITWRNVTINNGANAASLGNSAANFGRSAIQGLDIFSNQMQDRINREDQLLTNDAIAQALRGGPQVSNNRRVDASALQQAVSRRGQDIRAEETHESDLISAGLNQEGKRISNIQNQFIVDNQEETLRLEHALNQARLDNQQQQTTESKLRVEELQNQLQRATALGRLPRTLRQ